MISWNLLFILCFVLLYWGIFLVLSQLRQIREDQQRPQREPETVGANPQQIVEQCLQGFNSRLQRVEARLEERMNAQSEQISEGIKGVQQDLSFMSRSFVNMGSASSMGRGGFGGESSSDSRKNDAYESARLLLANGVDEEQVIEQTGLTIEEVSLLKRLATQESEPQDMQ